MHSDLFDYRDGHLYWKVSPSKKVRAGDRAGSMGKDYWRVGYRGRTSWFAHKIIWEMHHGPIPENMQVDHINQDKLDNRIENLRLATRSQNNYNSRRSHGRSKYKGVYKAGWADNKWFAKLKFKGKQMYFGTYDSEEKAAEAIDAAYKKYHGDFANLNEAKIKES